MSSTGLATTFNPLPFVNRVLGKTRPPKLDVDLDNVTPADMPAIEAYLQESLANLANLDHDERERFEAARRRYDEHRREFIAADVATKQAIEAVRVAKGEANKTTDQSSVVSFVDISREA